MLVVEMGNGKQKLMLVPGINVIDDKAWDGAKATLDAKIKAGVVVPIYKTTKKDGKEIEEPCKPDEIPNDKLDGVVNEIQSEAQADKFVEASSKESVRAKGMNRKNAIAKELKDRESENK
jgi:hypothetical protein